MRVAEHTVISAVAGGVVYYFSKSPVSAGSAFLAGIFIDIDHFVDYFLNVAFRIDIKDFFRKCTTYSMKKFYVPLHSYEVILLLIAVNLAVKSEIALGVLVGFSVHLMADLSGNFTKVLSYSLIYRIAKKFDSGKMYTPPYGNNKKF